MEEQTVEPTVEPREPVVDVNTTDFAVPEEFTEYAQKKNITSLDGAFKQLQEQDKLIGKKSLVPDWEKATPDEVDKYLSQLGYETPDKYQLPEGVFDEDETKTFQEMLHQAKVAPPQAKVLIDGYVKNLQATKEKLFSQEGFEKEMKESFGDGYKTKVAETSGVLKKHLNEKDAKIVESLPNQHVAVLYRLANNIAEAYGVKEGSADLNAGGGGNINNVEEVRAGLLQQIQDLASKPGYTAQDKQILVDKYNATFTQ